MVNVAWFFFLITLLASILALIKLIIIVLVHAPIEEQKFVYIWLGSTVLLIAVIIWLNSNV